ncbi:MAG: GatB/YqeY domain-containing protein [bacterium]|nr:GatB/YqeY domain-containing protein [bacterium]
MPIFDDVSEQMKEALKAGEKIRLSTLRSIRAALLNRMKEDGSDTVSDEECVTLMRRLEKQRRESIEAFQDAGRAEQAAAERDELAILQTFLPSLADETATRKWVEEAIESSGASSPGDVGRVMGALMKAHKGKIDGALARQIAADLLADPPA